MSYIKTQGMLAHEVITSDNTNVNYPSLANTGVIQEVEANILFSSGEPAVAGDPNTDFEELQIFAGDIVVNTTTLKKATVTRVIDKVKLEINTNIFLVAGEGYQVYNASAFKNLQDANNGCVLYIGTEGDLKVDTIAGSTVTFTKVATGFFPVQVKKVYATGTDAAKIIALW